MSHIFSGLSGLCGAALMLGAIAAWRGYVPAAIVAVAAAGLFGLLAYSVVRRWP